MREAHGALIVTHSGEQRADIRVPAAARHEHNGAFREHPRELARVKPPFADAATQRRAASHLTVKMYASRAMPWKRYLNGLIRDCPR
jgi:hypothetical protein